MPCDRAARGAQGRISIPKRFSLGVREMFAAQPRLEQPRGRRALRMLEQPRFRAGFDLLLLRADMGLAPRDIADWWTRVQEVSQTDRDRMADALGCAAAPAGEGGGGRRRRGVAAGVAVAAHPRLHERRRRRVLARPDMPRWLPAYVGVGSNLDDPRAQVRARVRGARAAAGIAPGGPLAAVSHAALRRRGAAAFVNAVAGLLTQLHARGAAGGAARASSASWAASRRANAGARAPSISTCWCSARETRATEALTLPHPGHRRARLRALSSRRHRAGSRRARAGPRRRAARTRRQPRHRKTVSEPDERRAAPGSAEAVPRAARSPTVPAQRYIVVEGPIGVGKTSLARRLAATLDARAGARAGRAESLPRALLSQPARRARCPRSCSSCSSARSSSAR